MCSCMTDEGVAELFCIYFFLYPVLCVFLFLISYKYLNFKITPVTESVMHTVNTHSLRTFSGQLKWRRI